MGRDTATFMHPDQGNYCLLLTKNNTVLSIPGVNLHHNYVNIIMVSIKCKNKYYILTMVLISTMKSNKYLSSKIIFMMYGLVMIVRAIFLTKMFM